MTLARPAPPCQPDLDDAPPPTLEAGLRSSVRSGATRFSARAVAPWVVIVALAAGGFGIGTTEFVSMGLLPDIADDTGVSIPTGGHVISAYALGVVVGAPLIAVLAARVPRRRLLIALAAALAVGNAASALAPDYTTLVGARFLAGLPHGAYFGVATLVAASLVAPHRRARAVGGVLLGLSIANVVGVPVVTWIGQSLGWRSAYWVVAAVCGLTVLALFVVAPVVAADPAASTRRELSAMRRPQVLVALLVGTVGFGGMFAIYSYITPTMTHVAGLPEHLMPLVLAAFGAGMVLGNVVGARLVDRSATRAMFFGMVATVALFGLFPLAAHNAIAGTAVLALSAVASSTGVIALQTRLMDVGGDAQTLAASMNHAALNLANALGAFLGGVAIGAGLGWTSTAWVAVALGLAGLTIMVYGMRLRPVRRAFAFARPDPTVAPA